MSHDHHHHGETKNIRVAFFLNLAFTIVEIIGGVYVNSVSILSDAVHDLGDSLSLGMSWYLQHKASQKPDKNFSFGYRRFSLLGALINSVILLIGGVYIITEAVERLMHPEVSDAQGMIYFAIAGIAVNGFAAWRLSTGKSMNEKVVTWHLLEDVLGWVAVLIASIILLFTDNLYIDPALSLLITAYILWNVVKRLKQTLFLFLQGQPSEIDRAKLEQEILAVEMVDSVHHTHIWSLDGEKHVFTTHVKLKPMDDMEQLLSVKRALKAITNAYPFEHHAIETELSDEECGEHSDHADG